MSSLEIPNLTAQEQTVAFYTLGCRTNQLESSALADEFRANGWSVLPFNHSAALYIINTCTVTAGGDSESRRIIRKAKRTNPQARVAVTGCYAQVSPGQVAGIEGVNYVIGNNFKQDIFRITQDVQPPENRPWIQVEEMDKSRIMAGASNGAIDRTRASLKIQDGCDFKCTYCIIWVARGPSRSLGISTLVSQLKDLLAKGHYEVVLTGINIGQYADPETQGDLTALLRELVAVPGDFRLRLSSLDPAEVTPELLDLMASTSKVCPHLHLSMQSAQDDVLKLMARRHRVRDLYALCQAIQSRLPNAAIGTDIITGFPQETPERFKETVQVLNNLPLSYFHTFTYSKRADTPAAAFDGQVSDAEKQRRTQTLVALSEAKNLAYRRHLQHHNLEVIVEENGKQGMSAEFIRVHLDAQSLPEIRQNQPLSVKIRQVSLRETWGTIIA